MIGKIVLVKVYFTDLSDYKIRPVYIFKKYDDEDYMFLPLSSNVKRSGIIIDDSCLKSGKLEKTSVVIIPKVGIIHKTLILQEYGELNNEYKNKILKKLCFEFGCK